MRLPVALKLVGNSSVKKAKWKDPTLQVSTKLEKFDIYDGLEVIDSGVFEAYLAAHKTPSLLEGNPNSIRQSPCDALSLGFNSTVAV